MKQWLLLLFIGLQLGAFADSTEVWQRRQLTPHASALFPASYDSIKVGALTRLTAWEMHTEFSITYGLPEVNYRTEIKSKAELKTFYSQLLQDQIDEVDNGLLIDSSTFWQDSLSGIDARFFMEISGTRNYRHLRAVLLNDQLVSLTATYPEDSLV